MTPVTVTRFRGSASINPAKDVAEEPYDRHVGTNDQIWMLRFGQFLHDWLLLYDEAAFWFILLAHGTCPYAVCGLRYYIIKVFTEACL
jgi:hypothetical protein